MRTLCLTFALLLALLTSACVPLGPSPRSAATPAPATPVPTLDNRAARAPAGAGGYRELKVLGYGYASDVAWSPDGKTLAVGAAAGVALYAAGDWTAAPRWHAVAGGANSIAYHPGGTLLAAAGEAGLTLWDSSTGQERHLQPGREALGAAFSPDGLTVAAGSALDDVRLWNVADGALLAELNGSDKAVTEVAFSPDGKTLAAAGGFYGSQGSGDAAVRLWDVQTGEPVSRLGGSTSSPQLAAAAFSPDGKILATGGFDNRVRLWEARSGKLLATMDGHTGDVVSLAFSPDGKLVASSAGWEDTTVRLWDATPGWEDATVRHWDAARAELAGCRAVDYTGSSGLAFSPDGRLLAGACGNAGVIVWDVATGEPQRIVAGYSGAAASLAFSPDGSLLASGEAYDPGQPVDIRLWDVAAANERARLPGHVAPITALAFDAGGDRLASGDIDASVRVWDLSSGEAAYEVKAPHGSEGQEGVCRFSDEDGDVSVQFDCPTAATVRSLAFSPDGARLAIGRGGFGWPWRGSFELYDAATAVRAGHDILAPVYGVAFSAGGAVLATIDGNGAIARWDAATAEERERLDSPSQWLGGAAFTPDGATVATVKNWSSPGAVESRAPGVRLRDAATGAELAGPLKGSADVQQMAFNRDGGLLAAVERHGDVIVWDVATGKRLDVIEGAKARTVAFAADDTLAVGRQDGTIRLWGTPGPQAITVANAGSLVQLASGGRGRIEDVAWSPDAARLALATATGLYLVDVATLAETHLSTSPSREVAFSPGGALLAAAEGSSIGIWDLASGQKLRGLEGHAGAVYTVAFSPAGDILASGSQDETAKLWDVASGKELHTLRPPTRPAANVVRGVPAPEQAPNFVYQVAFSPDGKMLAAAAARGGVALWDVRSGAQLPFPAGLSEFVAFAPDGKGLAFPEENRVGLVDIATGKELGTLEVGNLRGLAYSPDGALIAVVSPDGAIGLWDVAARRELRTLAGRTTDLSVVFSPDGRALASYGPTKIQLWDVSSGEVRATLTGRPEVGSDAVESLAFSPRGDVLAAGSLYGSVRLYDAGTGEVLAKLEGQLDRVTSVAFGRDGTVLAAGGQRYNPLSAAVQLWDVATRAPLLRLDDREDAVCAVVAFSPDGALLAAGMGPEWAGAGSVKVWNAVTSQLLADLPVAASVTPCALAFNPEGTLLAARDGLGKAWLWHVADWTVARTFDGSAGFSYGIAFSPDATLLATAAADFTDATADLRVWNIATSEQTVMPAKHTQGVRDVAFGIDGRLMASANRDRDGTVRLWDAATGELLATLSASRAAAVAFSPDGRLLASGGWDGVVRLWGLPPGQTD